MFDNLKNAMIDYFNRAKLLFFIFIVYLYNLKNSVNNFNLYLIFESKIQIAFFFILIIYFVNIIYKNCIKLYHFLI